jgi:hypothetical protein
MEILEYSYDFRGGGMVTEVMAGFEIRTAISMICWDESSPTFRKKDLSH